MHLAWAGEQEGGATALLVTGPAPAASAMPAGLAADRLAVVPADALSMPDAVVPMAGRWSEDGGALRFTPRFPFARGTTYALALRDSPAPPAAPGRGPARWEELARLQRPAGRSTPTTTVVAIHPDTAEVPENLLRLSVTFSAPMDEGAAAGHVHLQDADGTDLPSALLAMPPELWDRPRLRLTLLLEPGRIKRGLVPNTELGAPLAHSAQVSLLVDEGLRDASGADLVDGARHTYRVGAAVRAQVDPAAWRLAWPPAGSREALVARFDRPLDHALVLRCLRVTDSSGGAVPGRARLAPGDVEWSFTPASPWPGGGFEVHVDADLEDLAGNSVRRVFDRDLRRRQDDPLDATEVVLGPGGRTHLRRRPRR